MFDTDWHVYRDYHGVFFRVRNTEAGGWESQVMDYYHYNPPTPVSYRMGKKMFFYAWLFEAMADGNIDIYLLAAPESNERTPS
jgi:hypothetical protein